MQTEMTAPKDTARWQAVMARDPAEDGAFVFAVRTTGIYCRPSCPSRRPKRGNVAFYDLVRDAEADGFRACKRCRPKERSTAQRRADAVEQACRRLESEEIQPSLEGLAAAAEMSPHHFHRTFRLVTGTTPKAYAKAVRERRAADALAGAESVTEAIFAAGYASAARFYEGATDRLGMTPATYADGATGQRIAFGVAESSLGRVLVAATERGVCAVRFGADDATLEAELRARFPKAEIARATEDFDKTLAAVITRIERPAASEELSLDIQGTLFEQKVWAALREIPVGETRSYAEVAAAIGAPKAARAVARACAANPVAVLTPCHRVIAKSGALSGYAWGAERKAALLEREGARP